MASPRSPFMGGITVCQGCRDVVCLVAAEKKPCMPVGGLKKVFVSLRASEKIFNSVYQKCLQLHRRRSRTRRDLDVISRTIEVPVETVKCVVERTAEVPVRPLVTRRVQLPIDRPAQRVVERTVTVPVERR